MTIFIDFDQLLARTLCKEDYLRFIYYVNSWANENKAKISLNPEYSLVEHISFLRIDHNIFFFKILLNIINHLLSKLTITIIITPIPFAWWLSEWAWTWGISDMSVCRIIHHFSIYLWPLYSLFLYLSSKYF